MGCALTSPRFGARAAPGLGEGRLGAPRRPRLRSRGRGPRGGHSLARTPGPAPRGRGRRPGLLSLTPEEGEQGLGGVGGPEPPNKPKKPQSGLQGPTAALRAPPSGLRRCWVSAPHRDCCARLGNVRPRGSGPLAGASPGERALLPPLFFPLLFPPVSSRVAVSSTGLPDSLLFARRRPRSTAAQSAPFIYRVVFLTFESASHCVVALVSFDLGANLVIFLPLTPPLKSREY